MSDIFGGKVVDGTTTTVYGLITLTDAPQVSLQLEIEDLGSFAGAVSLWASNVTGVDHETDVGWVEMTTDHKFEGFVGLTAGALAGAVSAWADLGNANGTLYKVKVVRSAGSAKVRCHIGVKKSR